MTLFMTSIFESSRMHQPFIACQIKISCYASLILPFRRLMNEKRRENHELNTEKIFQVLNSKLLDIYKNKLFCLSSSYTYASFV